MVAAEGQKGSAASSSSAAAPEAEVRGTGSAAAPRHGGAHEVRQDGGRAPRPGAAAGPGAAAAAGPAPSGQGLPALEAVGAGPGAVGRRGPEPAQVFSPQLSSKTLWQLVRHRLGDSLRTLRVRGALLAGGRQRLLSPALLAALAKRCPRLSRLCLAEADLRPLPYESFPASLTALELSRCEIPAAWFCGSAARALPRLQHLVVRKVPAFSNQHLLNVSSRCCLKTLTLSGTYRVTDAGIQSAASRLEELERLVLRHCVVTDSALHFIGRHMKCLRFLEISSADSLTNAGLACLAALEGLETLHLDHCDKFSPDAIAALCRALPRLRNLKLDGADFGDEAMGKIQASLPSGSFSHTP